MILFRLLKLSVAILFACLIWALECAMKRKWVKFIDWEIARKYLTQKS